jgi:hypothetical protein
VIYKTRNIVNNKIYIGFHQTEDLDDGYMGSGKIIKRAIEKYGIENFEREILFVFDNPKEMADKESEIVNEEFVAREDTYNLKLGGEGGWDHIDYSIRSNEGQKKGRLEEDKVTALMGGNAMKEKIKDPEYAKIHSQRSIETWTGRNHSEESKNKMSESQRKRMSNPANNPARGKCWMYSLEEEINKMVAPDEVDKYLAMGYTKGRKIKF